MAKMHFAAGQLHPYQLPVAPTALQMLLVAMLVLRTDQVSAMLVNFWGMLSGG